MEKYGIENLKKAIALPIELGNIADAIGAENSKDWKRWFKLVDILDEVVDILRVDWIVVKQELRDLDEVEKAELLKAMKDKFDIKDDNLEAIIEESMDILVKVAEIVEKAITLAKAAKAE